MLGPCWACGSSGHLAANCPKKNQYPFLYTNVCNNALVYVSESNGDPLRSICKEDNEVSIKPREGLSSEHVNISDSVSILILLVPKRVLTL